jgi:hypothetical protein
MEKYFSFLLLTYCTIILKAQEYHHLLIRDGVEVQYKFNNEEQLLYLRLTNNGNQKVYAGPENVLWYNGAIQVAKQNGAGITLQPGESSSFGMFWTYPKGYQKGYTFKLQDFKVEIGGQGKDSRYNKPTTLNRTESTDPLPEIVFPGNGLKTEKSVIPNNNSNTTNLNTNTVIKPDDNIKLNGLYYSNGTISQINTNSNSNISSSQRQQYQNQANIYLSQAQNTNQSGISQQLNLDLAKINAITTGNAQQVQQIQQQQNQLNQQRNEQLAQSTAAFVGSVFSLIEKNRQRKLENERRWQEEAQQRKQEERYRQQIIKAVKEDLEPLREESLDFIRQGLEIDSTAYLKSTDYMQKVCISASWLLKQKEKKSIEESSPDVDVLSDGSYTVKSTGHITPAAVALVAYESLPDSFFLQELKPSYYHSVNDFLYPVEVPYKANRNYRKKWRFLNSNSKSVDILYAKITVYATKSYEAENIASALAGLDKLNYTPDTNYNYKTEFTETYAHYKGHGWKSMYSAGYSSLKKLDAMRILGNIILDSAISKQEISGVYRAASQYSKAFNWYNDHFGRIENFKSHPIELLDKLFLDYSASVMIQKKWMRDTKGADNTIHIPEMMKKYLADFDNYKILIKKTGQAKAQIENGSTGSVTQKNVINKPSRNFIKTNITGILLKNYSLQYERILNRKFSVAVQYRTMPASAIPFHESILDAVGNDDSDTKKIIENFRLSNYAITPEVRFYASRRGYGQGFYIAPFYRYASFTTNDLNVFYTDEHGIESSIKLSGKLNTNTGGILFGVQGFLGRHVVLDMWIFGPHFGSGKGDFVGTSSKSLTQSEQDDLRQRLEDIDIPLTDKTVNVDSNGVTLKLDGPWGGIRGGISLGVKF